MIEFHDVCKSYRIARRESGLGSTVKSFFHRKYDTIDAINHISFTINDGEMVGYIGPNGAGKSLLRQYTDLLFLLTLCLALGITAAFCMVIWLLCYFLWRYGVKHYKSCGS